MSTNRKKSSTGNKRSSQPVARRRRSQDSMLPIILGGGILVVLIVLVLFFVNNSSASAGPITDLRTFPNLERGHTNQAVSYVQNPPAGGQHHPAWQNCGVYTEPVPNENAVHSLEHGAIWITYQPDLAADQLQKLQRLTRQSGYRLLSPFPGLPAPIVASAWGYQIELQDADDPRLNQFIRKYEQNPLGPEPGAACTGGVGQPE